MMADSEDDADYKGDHKRENRKLKFYAVPAFKSAYNKK